MQIKVTYEPNQLSRTDVFTPADFGLSDEDWELMSDDDKRSLLTDAVEHEPPYWAVNYITENH